VREPILAAMPWEFLYDTGTDTHLGLDLDTRLVRYLPCPARPTPMSSVTDCESWWRSQVRPIFRRSISRVSATR
jgi:hypothetical protein